MENMENNNQSTPLLTALISGESYTTLIPSSPREALKQLPRVKTLPKKDVISGLIRLLLDTQFLHNVKWEEGQNAMLVERLLHIYPTFTVEEMAYILQEGSSGAWGNLYPSFNPAHVLSWFAKYDNIRPVAKKPKMYG